MRPIAPARLLLAITVVLCWNFTPTTASDPVKPGAIQTLPIETGFSQPPPEAKARTWWHWINGNVSRQGITADLESMKAVGIQEAQIFNVSLGDPPGPATYLSPQWLDLFAFAAVEAKRLGLELSFHNGPGWSSSGGPWVTAEHAMQTVVFSELTHAGGKPFAGKLPRPKAHLNYYRDIAVLAFPTPQVDGQDRILIDGLDYKTLSDRVRNHLSPDPKKIPAAATIQKSSIVNLTDQANADGTLRWDAPPGQWTILRLGHTPTGARNRPGPVGGSGLECDKMSREAVDVFWEGGIAPILEKLDSVDAGLTNCIIDSYEVGTANWTPGFEKSFSRLRGYDCVGWLPTLAGYYVDSGEHSERFLWDFRRTIGDLMAENYYAYFRERCHQNGMKLSVEPYWGPFDNMQIGQHGDIVMCEFWSGDIAFFDSPKFVASIAKLNGDAIVGAEAFTGLGGWAEHPATIKSIGDRAWAQGINRFIFHSFVHQPWDVGPGLTLGPHGLELNRLNTWWKQGEAFLDYVARGQFLLQQGQSVADVLLFTGEGSPNDAWLMPQIKSMGYDYDLIGANKFQSLSVVDGLICTPTGGSYRALLMRPTDWMKPETIQKLKELVDGGAVVFGPRPVKSPSLENYPQCDQQVQQLAQELWGTGRIEDRSILDYLKMGAVPPDFDVEQGDDDALDFIHRRSGDADIYFVASSRKQRREVRCRFRVTGKLPEFFDAQTGAIATAAQWHRNDDGTTTVDIGLDSEQSIFVVFHKPVAVPGNVVAVTQVIQQNAVLPLRDLKIIDAQYGTFLPDGLIDVTEILAGEVRNNRLAASANRDLMGSDPAPGYHKELRVKYKIGDAIEETEVMEREQLVLNQAGEKELEIVEAVFGKFAAGISGVPGNYAAKEVTQKVKDLIDSGIVEIPVDQRWSDGDDTAAGQLRVVYSTDGQLQKRVANSGATLNLGRDMPQPRLEVVDGETVWFTPRSGKLTYQRAVDGEHSNGDSSSGDSGSNDSGDTRDVQVQSVPSAVDLAGPWQVEFQPDRGAPAAATFEQLMSWPASSDSGIQFFSGTAKYQKQFELPAELLQPEISLELDLGTVCVIAEVTVNGKQVGTLWRTPFKISLDGLARVGVNQLEVSVTNLWPNRLIGDARLPGDVERKRGIVKRWPDWLLNPSDRDSGRIGFPAYQHWDKDSQLKPSGLLGPVKIRPYVKRTLKTDP